MNAIPQNEPTMNNMLISVSSRGWYKRIAAAATNPELAALIPSSEALTGLNFLRLSQIRMTKNIRNVPGKKIPKAEMNPPMISPP